MAEDQLLLVDTIWGIALRAVCCLVTDWSAKVERDV